MLREHHVGYPVLHNGDLVGIVTLDDTRSVKEVERDAYLVEDVMTRDIQTVDPTSDVMDVFEVMQTNNVGRLPVTNAEGDLVGLISRSDLMMAFNIAQSGGSLGSILSGDRSRERP
jgi:CBS domain-containing protein